MNRIQALHIRKTFKIGFERKNTLSHLARAFSGREQKRELLALDDVSLEVKSGEIVGMIGKNGSGKSTLLRIIVGIYAYDSGDIAINGKIISIIHLGIVLKERLTMRDNIFLVGSLFGMNQKEIKNQLASIVEFAELAEFIHTKIYQFSSGMLQRLAFSIAIHAKPDILLLDEVLEVGDEHFREKSGRKIRELAANGTSVVFVTHDLGMIEKYCQRAVWLANGKVRRDDRPSSVIQEYIRN